MDLNAIFNRPFAEQLEFFRGKLNLPTERWDDILRAAHDRAFIVAGAAKADLLDDLRRAVDKAISQGTTIDEFRRDFKQIVFNRGWHGWTGEGSKPGEAWRTRVIYQTNLSTSYAAGRMSQLKEAGYTHWMYKHSDSVLHPRPHHLAMDGVVRPADDPFWQVWTPPNGWGCKCRVLGVRNPEHAKLLGGDWDKPLPESWNARDGKGDIIGIDHGWDYQPGAQRLRPLKDLIDQKLIKLDAPIGAAMAEALKPVLLKEAAESFVLFVEKTLLLPVPRNELMVVGAIKLRWLQKAEELGVKPASANISVLDKDIWHTFREAKTNQLELDWYKQLPYHLDAPSAVVLDKTHDEPAFLLIFDGTDKSRKLVVQINYKVKKVGLRNIVETGKFVDVSGIRAMIGNGYTLIEGSL